MDKDVKAALRQSVLTALPTLRNAVSGSSETHLVWSRQSDGSWHGEHRQFPSVRYAFIAALRQIEEASTRFSELFRMRHPEHGGLVGTQRLGSTGLGGDLTKIPRTILGELWARHGSFEVSDAAVDSLIDELEDFIDRPTIRFRFQAVLLNYVMERERLEFPGGLAIRKLTEQEMSALYGGPVDSPGLYSNRQFGMHEFVIEGETEEQKKFGDVKPVAGLNNSAHERQ